MPGKRSNTTALTRLLGDHPHPVYAISRDARLVYCNRATLDWLGVGLDELLGQTCRYVSLALEPGESGPRPTDGLCPPPETFRSRLGQPVEVHCWRSGEAVRRWANVVPLGEAVETSSRSAAGEGGSTAGASGEPVGGECDLLVICGPGEDLPADSQASLELGAALHARLARFWSKVGAPGRLASLLGDSPGMERVRTLLDLAGQQVVRTLLLGPAGTGREALARELHARQFRDVSAPLAAVECGVQSAETLQATITELIRGERSDRLATLLLLEVDQLPVEAQRELSGFLQLPHFNLHTLATARRSLVALASAGSFEGRLAQQLSTLTIEVPGLSERLEDVALLAQHYLEQLNAERAGEASRRQLSGFSDEAMWALSSYGWPGNLRQLREVVRASGERAVGTRIEVAELGETLRHADLLAAHPGADREPIELDAFLAQVEAELLGRALRLARGNKARAARQLGISRPRLLRRLEQLGVAELAPSVGPPAAGLDVGSETDSETDSETGTGAASDAGPDRGPDRGAG